MALFDVKSITNLEAKISGWDAFDKNVTDEMVKKAIYQGAAVVADQIHENLRKNLDDPASVSKKGNGLVKNQYSETTGDLWESFGISKMDSDRDGWNVKIGFDGYDRKGVPNVLKARAMESGTSTLKKRPFVRPAVRTAGPKAVIKMGEIIDEEIARIMND